MESITRRVFLKRAVSGVGGVMLAKSLGPNVSGLAQPPADMSRVVVVEHSEATDGVKVINPVNAQAMVDEAVKQLTGESSVADAWASLLPDFKEEHLVAIKVNAVYQAVLIPTHPVVVDAIVTGLLSAGVRENNIIIYDRRKQELTRVGYSYNAGDVGVRCLATDEKGWGYDRDNRVDILGQRESFSSILTRCDHLINVPVLKVMPEPFKVTLSMKNHFGSVDNPQLFHNNFATACATLNSQEAITSKTRLIAIDALFGCCGSNIFAQTPDCAPNSLIVSRDTVAADYIGTEMLNEQRAKRNFQPKNMPLLGIAAEMGLGTNDPEKMEVLKVDLGPQKEEKEEAEEEVGKAVEPADSYKTQWGRVKNREDKRH
jgi:uncharacterized protein (DUF362 family)